MSIQPHEIPRLEWQRFLDDLTEEHAGDEVTIEVLDEQLGNQEEVQRLPLAYVEYDPKDDAVIVGVGGRDGRFPIVLRDIIEQPQRILADAIGNDARLALEIAAADGSQTIVTLHRPSA
jgi:hypothetical protein